MESFIKWYVNNYELFIQKLKEEEDKLPYNLNILDEIRADENAHSRILVKLLKYSQHGDYCFLRLFLHQLGDPFDKLECKHPVITAEKDRIDARICEEGKYSIIIENKIHEAVEQHRQIERYIDNEVNKIYKLGENIYVLYLTNEGGSPSEYSISKKYKDLLGNNYKEISYREHILRWLWSLLENEVNTLPLKEKDRDVIISAITQYANYLHGLFHEREGEKEMDRNIKQYLKTQLKLESDPEKNIGNFNNIKTHLSNMEKMTGYLKCIQAETENVVYDFLNGVVKKLGAEIGKGKYKVFHSLELEGRFGEHDSLVLITPKGWDSSYCIGISFERILTYLFYGIYCKKGDGTKEKSNVFFQKFEDKQKNSNWDYWLYWKYFDPPYYNLYQDLPQFVEHINDGSLKETMLTKIMEIYRAVEDDESLKKYLRQPY
jgi:hypothetical protein